MVLLHPMAAGRTRAAGKLRRGGTLLCPPMLKQPHGTLTPWTRRTTHDNEHG